MKWVVAALVLAVSPFAHAAPAEAASFVVIVRDVDGTPLPGALVSLHRIPAQGEVSVPDQTRATRNDGCARLDGIAAGQYTVTVELSGFATVVIGPFSRWNLTSRQSPDQPERLLIVMNPIQTCGDDPDANGP